MKRIFVDENIQIQAEKENKYTDENGFVTYKDVIVARTGMQEYLKSELSGNSDDTDTVELWRLSEDVEKSISSLNNKPILESHPSQNLKFGFDEQILGVATDARFEEEVVKCSLTFFRDFDNKEISLGYSAEIVHENRKYYQKNITINHVAVVLQGRCGRICKIHDKGKNMAKITIADKQYDVPEEVDAYIDTLKVSLEASRKEVKDSVAKAQKEMKALNTLVEKAKTMGLKDADITGKTAFQIKQTIVDSIDGLNSKNKKEEYLDAVIDTYKVMDSYTPATVPNKKIKSNDELTFIV